VRGGIRKVAQGSCRQKGGKKGKIASQEEKRGRVRRVAGRENAFEGRGKKEGIFLREKGGASSAAEGERPKGGGEGKEGGLLYRGGNFALFRGESLVIPWRKEGGRGRGSLSFALGGVK